MMTRLTLIFIVLPCCCYKVNAQSNKDTAKSTVLVDPIEVSPEFPGGFKELQKFIKSNLHQINVPNGKSVIVSFVVEKDGGLTDIKIARGVNAKADSEELRIIRLSPKWKPASQNGLLYRVAYLLPIAFN